MLSIRFNLGLGEDLPGLVKHMLAPFQTKLFNLTTVLYIHVYGFLSEL